MIRYVLLLIVLFSMSINAQSSGDSAVGSKYLEDQFYVGLNYNFLLNKPDNVTQSNLSYGLQGGIIKDIPINARRNIAFGIGLGYSVNSYFTNLQVTETTDGFQYRVLESGTSFKRSKIETHAIEMPIEFRWRNSTADSYKFWRVYTGVKLGYVVGSRSKFVSMDEKFSFYNTDTVNFQYGIMINLGYNTFNVHAYYALNEFFESGTQTVDNSNIDFTPLRIGIIFYIL
ncbi:PorT family protein [Muriicola sp. Z0-33]|nr:PorT family protein [Muriicola sp. Z0-33]